MSVVHRSPQLLPLKNDFVFKLVFGNQYHVDLLTAFLQSVLDLPAEEYEKVTIIDPNIKKEYITDKAGVLDVKITTKTGNVVNVEIQIEDETSLRKRIAYYQSKMIDEQISAGDDYDVIKKVISIVIADFKMIKESPDYWHTFRMHDALHNVEFSDIQEIHTLELPKLPKEITMSELNKRSELVDWLMLFKAKTTEDYEMLAQKNPTIGKAVAVIKRLSADEQTRAEFETREKWRMDYAVSMRHAAERGLEQGLEQGLEKGMKQGKGERSFEIARNLKAMGMTTAAIVQATGLSETEIEQLK
jgi:predicted transposase/invertase (TIGR01784 family)